jgi:hypothetical protein
VQPFGPQEDRIGYIGEIHESLIEIPGLEMKHAIAKPAEDLHIFRFLQYAVKLQNCPTRDEPERRD